MKAIAERNALNAACMAVKDIASSDTTIPILQHLRLDAKDGHIAVSACDCSMQATATLPAETPVHGALCVPAKPFAGGMAKAPAGGTVTLSNGDGRADVDCGAAKYDLPILDADRFPDLEMSGAGAEFEIAADDLASMLGACKDSAGTSDTRQYLCGVMFHDDGGCLTAVGSNGHVMAIDKRPLPAGAEGLRPTIIPNAAVSHIHKWAKRAEGAFKIDAGPSHIKLSCGLEAFVSTLIAGTYPEYGRLVPDAKGPSMSFALDAMATALDRVAPVEADTGGVKISPANGSATISARHGSKGQGSATLDIDGDMEPLGFYRPYLGAWVEVVRSRGAERGTIYCEGPGHPLLCLADGDENLTHVIMPMRLPW